MQKSGDYSNALRFASQALTIEQNLVKTQPNDGQLLRQLAQTEDQVGGILQMLNRPTDSIDHFKRSLELSKQLLNQNPGDTNLESVQITHFRIGNVLIEQNRAKEALEQFTCLTRSSGWIALWTRHSIPGRRTRVMLFTGLWETLKCN